MGRWGTRAQGSHRGRKAWAGGVRKWCGRGERSGRNPDRSEAEDPAGVGAPSTRDRMRHHGGEAYWLNLARCRGLMHGPHGAVRGDSGSAA